MPRKVEISHRTIIFTVLFLLFLWFLFYIKDILLELFVALLLMTVLQPMVALFTKIRIPRAISVLLSYIVVFGLLGGVIALIIPALVDQTTSFVNALPIYFSKLGLGSYINMDLWRELLGRLGSIPGQIFNFTVSIFSNVVAVVTVLVFAFYMLLARNKLDDQLAFLFGEDRKEEIGKVIDILEKRLGSWARGQFLLMLVVGLATYIGLSLIGIPYALPLSLLAGVMEIIPFLGPVISAIPSVIIGFGISPVVGFSVALMAFLIQQAENYIFVPKIMEKSVGVSPIITLIALAIGARFLGIVGMIISVPSVITLQVILKHFVLGKE